MNRPTARIEQSPATQNRHDLRLIPPLAEEFSVSGGPAVLDRARFWALDRHYLLADGVPACAHGLYLIASCPGPGTCRMNFPQLDRARVWVPATTEDARPFILMHPYSTEIAPETLTYGQAHGLTVTADLYSGDDWYGFSTMPIRMSLPQSWPLWPIEAASVVLLSTMPVRWPDEEEQR
jgi:hypothetical protein